MEDLRLPGARPAGELRPAVAEKLRRRCAPGCCTTAAATRSRRALFVHPQTVRYRMQQLRDVYGDRLEDPDWVLRLTLALA